MGSDLPNVRRRTDTLTKRRSVPPATGNADAKKPLARSNDHVHPLAKLPNCDATGYESVPALRVHRVGLHGRRRVPDAGHDEGLWPSGVAGKLGQPTLRCPRCNGNRPHRDAPGGRARYRSFRARWAACCIGFHNSGSASRVRRSSPCGPLRPLRRLRARRNMPELSKLRSQRHPNARATARPPGIHLQR